MQISFDKISVDVAKKLIAVVDPNSTAKLVEVKNTSTNTGSPKLLNSLSEALPLVKNGMSSEEIHKVRCVIADAIDQLRAGA